MHNLFKPSAAPKINLENSIPFYDWLERNIKELIHNFDNELKANTDDEEDINILLQKNPFRKILHEFVNATLTGLKAKIAQTFNFKLTMILVQACIDEKFSKEIKTKLLHIAKKQFYIVLIFKINTVISLLRRELNLSITTNEQSDEVDPLNSLDVGPFLLGLRSICINSFYKTTESYALNIEALLTLNRASTSGNYSIEIKNYLSQIYQIIMEDIKTPESHLGGHFLYSSLPLPLATEIIRDLLHQERVYLERKIEQQRKTQEEARKQIENESNQLNKEKNKKIIPVNKKTERDKQNAAYLEEQTVVINYGELIWKICFNLNSAQIKELLEKDSNLVTQMRLSSGFQAYELLARNQMLCRHVLQFPWFMSLFTIRQMIDFINSPPTPDTQDILIARNFHLTITASSDETSCTGKSLFAPKTNLHNDKSIPFPTPTPKENNKKMLLNFLVSQIAYSKKVINELTTQTQFVSTIGIHRELLPLIEPSTLINLFLEADSHLPIALADLQFYMNKEEYPETKITGNMLRDFIEYEWMLIRIIEDIKQGNNIYFNKLLKIPYVLYELVKREKIGQSDFLQLPKQKLLEFFTVFDHKIILDTLRLLDPEDKINSHMRLNEQNYEVDKPNSKSAFQRFAQFLSSMEFFQLRCSWLQIEEARTILQEYPFLLKGFNSNTIHDFVNDDRATLLNYANLSLQNGVNPFFYCPQLLIYLNTDQIFELFTAKNSMMPTLFEKEMPKEVVRYLTGHMAVLKSKIPNPDNIGDLTEETRLAELARLNEVKNKILLLEHYLKKQNQIAELDALLNDLPADSPKIKPSASQKRNEKDSMSLDEAMQMLESEEQRQKELKEQAAEQARREEQRKKQREEIELKLKQAEDAHHHYLEESERQLEQLRAEQQAKKEELVTIKLAFADQKERFDAEIAREQQQWELERARMQQEKAFFQKQIEEESLRRKAEKEENDKNAAELAQMLIREQELLIKETEQRAKELEEILQKQEAERKAYELQLKISEEAHRLKMTEYERAQKEIMDRNYANKQEELEQLKKQREAEIKRREEELEIVRLAQEQQKAKIAEELRQRKREEQERVEKAQQDLLRKKEQEEDRKRKELEDEQLFQQKEEERRQKQLELEERQKLAIEKHIKLQNKNQKAIEEYQEKEKIQNEERAALERQAEELARAKKEMEVRRKKLNEEEDRIIKEKAELQKRTEATHLKQKELEKAHKTQEETTLTLNALEAELKLMATTQQELQQQFQSQLVEKKQQELAYKQKLEENERALKQQEEEFRKKAEENTRLQKELEDALRTGELQRQRLEEEHLKQEQEHQAMLEKNKAKRTEEAQKYQQHMELLEKELQEQQGVTEEQIETKRKEIEHIKKERAQELVRQQQEIEKLQREEDQRKKQLAEEKQRKQEEMARHRKSVDDTSREIEESRVRMLNEAARKRAEREAIETERKKQEELNRKLAEEQQKLQREAEALQSQQKALEEARKKQAQEKEALSQKEAELAREKQKEAAHQQQLAEQERKLILERQQRAAEQERQRKEHEEYRRKEEERKRLEEERKKAEQEKNRKVLEVRKKEDERKRMEEERIRKADLEKQRKTQIEQTDREKIEKEHLEAERVERSLQNRRQELAVQSSSAALPSSTTKTPSDAGITSSTPPRLIRVDSSRGARFFDPTTVAAGINNFTRDEEEIRRQQEEALKLTPPSPVAKGKMPK